MNEYVTCKRARAQLGCSVDSLRRWSAQGSIEIIRTPGGQRLYNLRKFLDERSALAPQEGAKGKVAYCRVSSTGQRGDLERQVQHLKERFPTHRVITDIGSGINFKRKGLRTVLELAM